MHFDKIVAQSAQWVVIKRVKAFVKLRVIKLAIKIQKTLQVKRLGNETECHFKFFVSALKLIICFAFNIK